MVIGAGPAGCIIAKRLAENGLKVVLIEKCKLPRNKSCSGVLIKRSKELVERYVGKIPEAVTCAPAATRGIVIKTETGKEHAFGDDGLNIWRERFDYWLTEQAVSHGAELLDSAVVTEFAEQSGALTLAIRQGDRDFKINGRVAIACDGVNGASRSKLGIEGFPKIITYQAFYRGTAKFDPHCFYAFLDSKLSEYDAWANIKDDRLFLGVGVRRARNATEYLRRFIDYLSVEYGLRLQEKLGEEYWALPVIVPDFDLTFRSGRVFFAGEAAGLLNPLGEGISGALISGLAFAETILKSYPAQPWNVDEIHQNYQLKLKPEVEHMKRQWVLLDQLSPGFWDKVRRSPDGGGKPRPAGWKETDIFG